MLQHKQPVSMWRLIWTIVTVLIAVIWLLFFFPVSDKAEAPAAEDATKTATSAAANDVAEKPTK